MSNRGQHSSHAESLSHDGNFCFAAHTYIRSHACQKGEPNLTGKMLVDWVKTEYNCAIHETTACCWMHQLGFSRIHHQKEVYLDGHDWADVVAYRNEFLERMDDFDTTCFGDQPQL